MGRYGSAEQNLSSELRGESASQTLHLIHGLLDHGEPKEVEAIGCNINTNLSSSEEDRRYDLSYQIQFEDSWVLVALVIDQNSNGTVIAGFHFYPERESIQTQNRFTLTGKPVTSFLILALCIFVPIFIIYALVRCIRTPLRRKWLWIIFILFGLGELQLNWTNNQFVFSPLSIVLFGSSSLREGLYGPWTLAFGIPVGAIVFLLRRRKLMIVTPKPPIQESGPA
jgi:hypothetical protein